MVTSAGVSTSLNLNRIFFKGFFLHQPPPALDGIIKYRSYYNLNTAYTEGVFGWWLWTNATFRLTPEWLSNLLTDRPTDQQTDIVIPTKLPSALRRQTFDWHFVRRCEKSIICHQPKYCQYLTHLDEARVGHHLFGVHYVHQWFLHGHITDTGHVKAVHVLPPCLKKASLSYFAPMLSL